MARPEIVDRAAVEVLLHDGRAHVRGARDRRRVSEPLGHPAHDGRHGAFLALRGVRRRAEEDAEIKQQLLTRAFEEKIRLGLSQDEDYAVLHPTALYATKQWAPENFARLGSYLEGEVGLRVVYSCGPGESAVLDAVERGVRARIRRLETASLSQFAAALAEARLFVGNDSGPAHMAGALECPSVVIFGSSSSVIWGPWPPQGPGRIVQNFYDCNPCPGDRCYRFERPECVLSVTFEQVRSAVQAVLAQPVRPSR